MEVMGKRRRGRQKRRLLDSTRNDLSKKGLPWMKRNTLLNGGVSSETSERIRKKKKINCISSTNCYDVLHDMLVSIGPAVWQHSQT